MGLEKRKSNEEDNTIVVVPVVVKPVAIPPERRAVPVDVRHVPVAIGVAETTERQKQKVYKTTHYTAKQKGLPG